MGSPAARHAPHVPWHQAVWGTSAPWQQPRPRQEVLLFEARHYTHPLLFWALPGLLPGLRWLPTCWAPPCAPLLQPHRPPQERTEPPSLTLRARRERTPGGPGPTRAPSPASPWGCTDFKLLQAGRAGGVQGYCRWGRSSSCQRRRFVPGPQNRFFFSKVLARVLVSLRVSLGTRSLEALRRS